MSQKTSWLGAIGVLLIVSGFGLAMLREPARQVEAAADIRSAAITEGVDLYVKNCVTCHGASGEGMAAWAQVDPRRGRATSCHQSHR